MKIQQFLFVDGFFTPEKFFQVEQDGRVFIVGVEDWFHGSPVYQYSVASIHEGSHMPQEFMGYGNLGENIIGKEDVSSIPTIGMKVLEKFLQDGTDFMDESHSLV